MSPAPHFFQLFSRLGLRFLPSGADKLNLGVEYGPEAVVSKQFLSDFPQAAVSALHFPLPEDVATTDYYSLLTREFKQAIAYINQNIKPNQQQVVIGGDHSVAFASVGALLKRYNPSKVGVVLCDSHGDLNLIKTSLSKNFHGMWLRAMVSKFDHSGMDSLVPNKLPLKNLGLLGNMILDPDEAQFINQNKISSFSSRELLAKWLAGFAHVHLSFDIDVFNQKLVSATGTPNPDGLERERVFDLLTAFQGLPDFSLDLVEVNPQKPGAEQTISLAQEVLRFLLVPQKRG